MQSHKPPILSNCQGNPTPESEASASFSQKTVKEQRAIATILSDMDAAISALETRRTKTQAIKQGMMQELLTGQVRLKINSASQ